MRILMFGMSSYPGGIENYIANYFLHEEFAREATIDFVTYEGCLAYQQEIEKHGYSMKAVPHLKKHPLGYMRAVKKLMREGGYDCVYVNMLSAANILPIRYAVKEKIAKIVVHAHANATVKGFLRRFLHKKNKRYCQKKAHFKFTCSKEAGVWLYDDHPSELIPNAIDAARFAYSESARAAIRAQHNVKDTDFVIGHVGRLAQEKNHLFLVEVLAKVSMQMDNVKLLLVGDGPMKSSIEERSKELGVADKVILAGTSHETEKYYSTFDCFAFPSVFEGFGMAALEAQAAGLTCFCSNTLSKELKVTDTVEFLDLGDTQDLWAERILASVAKERLTKNVELPEAFDVAKQRKKLLEILR